MPNADPGHQPESEPSEPAEPLNRAERRAQRRGKKSSVPTPEGYGPPDRRRNQVVVPRRSGRRGNR